MSADNGIYILETKDQYRVAHFKNAEYMNYSPMNMGNDINEIIPSRVVELWGDCKFTKNRKVALYIANKWMSKLPVCEYGINFVQYNKTWKQILVEAKKYAREEIAFISKFQKDIVLNRENLKKIAEGYYLSEWLNREKYHKDLKLHNCS